MLPPEDIPVSLLLLAAAQNLPGLQWGMNDEDWQGLPDERGLSGGSNPWARMPAPFREQLKDIGVGTPTLGPDYEPGPWEYSENTTPLDPEVARQWLIWQQQRDYGSAPQGAEYPPDYVPPGPYRDLVRGQAQDASVWSEDDGVPRGWVSWGPSDTGEWLDQIEPSRDQGPFLRPSRERLVQESDPWQGPETTPSMNVSGTPFWDWSGNWLSDINQFNPVEWLTADRGPIDVQPPTPQQTLLPSGGGLSLLDLVSLMGGVA